MIQHTTVRILTVKRSRQTTELDNLTFNTLTTNVPTIKKPVNWFALQINWLVSLWWGAVVANDLTYFTPTFSYTETTQKIYTVNQVTRYYMMVSLTFLFKRLGPSPYLNRRTMMQFRLNISWLLQFMYIQFKFLFSSLICAYLF